MEKYHVRACAFCCSDENKMKNGYQVECLKCGAEGPVGKDEQDAVDKWNFRGYYE